MKEKKSLALTIIFLLSTGFLILLFTIFDVNHFFLGIIFYISLVFIVLIFVISSFFLKRLIAEIKYDVEDKKIKEKNVKDYYQYIQVLNPPDINN